MKQTIKGFLAILIGIIISIGASAQVTTSSISGRVTDAQGGVAGAAIIITYLPSGVNYYSVADEKGYYRVNSTIPGGPYEVKVEFLGYRPSLMKNIETVLGENTVVNVRLEEDSINLEALVFSADVADADMNINRAGVGTSISQRVMSSLPTANRTMNDVMKLTPQSSSTSVGFAIGGGNYRSSYVTVDGAAFNNAFGIGGNLPANGTPISLDALEQIAVNITPFDVRYSGFTGGAINAVTKRGTNEWHASVYNYYNSGYVNGRNVGDDKVAFVQSLNNTTGVSVGGPVIKDKLFFFVNFEYDLDEVPGSEYVAQTTANPDWAPGTSVNRPTVGFLNEVKKYLKDEYGYDPGEYQGYSLSTPDWKLLARVDWTINDNHNFNLRYSHTMNKVSDEPSSSISPLKNVYNRNYYGRLSQYAMYFESSRHFKEKNFMSLAAELNSQFGNNVSNTLRFTWSHQHEPRSFVGDLFPTVDILENIDVANSDGSKTSTPAVLTSFGVDPFTYGNLADVQTIVATDEVAVSAGINNLVAGLQFEWNNTKNGYMQGGAGYYVYNSWDDFVNDRKPAAFAITHSNRDDLKQVYPSFRYMQLSAYVQDEIKISDYFNLTAGVRVEVPFYPTVKNNVNKDFARLAAIEGSSLYGLSTADMPKARVNVSPRLGFNWDILKDRNLVLRGGTGIYTGRLPFVWIASSVLNSNCMQATYVDSTGGTDIGFHATTSEILEDLYGGKFKAQDLPSNQYPTILDKKLKMPTTWKSSLALDGSLPGGVKATLEGIYNKDLSSVYINLKGVEEGTPLQLPGEPQARVSWKYEDGMVNSSGSPVVPYYLTNSKLKGHYWSVSLRLKKDFDFGLSMMAAYTRSGSKSLSEGVSDQVTSAFSSLTYTKDGSNVAELGHSAYVSPNRIVANVAYRIPECRLTSTTVGLFYEGLNYAYMGEYGCSRRSYLIGTSKGYSLTGESGALNLIYIPTAEELAGMPFDNDENRSAFENFIRSDRYLSRHRGEYSTRGAVAAPWHHRINFRVAQDFYFNVAKKTNTIQIALDIDNVGNLLNRNWGVVKSLASEQVLTYDKGKYTFVEPQWNNMVTLESTWSMLLSLRYFF